MTSLRPHPIFSVTQRVGCAGAQHPYASQLYAGLTPTLPCLPRASYFIDRVGTLKWKVPGRISGLVCREARQPLDLGDSEGYPGL